MSSTIFDVSMLEMKSLIEFELLGLDRTTAGAARTATEGLGLERTGLHWSCQGSIATTCIIHQLVEQYLFCIFH